jgi:homoserine O-acetyltransferase
MAGKKTYDLPDSPNSVGWTEAKSIRLATEDEPFILETGGSIGPVDIEYETYGELSPGRDNVVIVEHALSGDAHVAGWDKKAYHTGNRQWLSRKPGWWDSIVGPGKAIDTKNFFVICSNYPGSCYGSTGPSSINPATGKPYGLTFPMVTVHDWVRLQSLLLEKLGIEHVYAVTGGSLGGQQAIEWALAYPERVGKIIVLAASPCLSSQGLAFNAVGRFCIMNDPNFNGGNYYDGAHPQAGLAAARMLAHITYLSEKGMGEKFGRRLRNKEKPDFCFNIEFEVESYLDYQGRSFVERFDANSYLYITRAMDYYDAAVKWGDGDLTLACERIKADVMIVSFSSDWLYPPAQCKEFALALSKAGKPVTYVNIPSQYGHDSFLVETEQVGNLLQGFLMMLR